MKININKAFTKNELQNQITTKKNILWFFSAIVYMTTVFLITLSFQYDYSNVYTKSILFLNLIFASQIIQAFDSFLEVTEEESMNLLQYAEKDNEVESYIKSVNSMGRPLINKEYQFIRSFFYDKVRAEQTELDALYAL